VICICLCFLCLWLSYYHCLSSRSQVFTALITLSHPLAPGNESQIHIIWETRLSFTDPPFCKRETSDYEVFSLTHSLFQSQIWHSSGLDIQNGWSCPFLDDQSIKKDRVKILGPTLCLQRESVTVRVIEFSADLLDKCALLDTCVGQVLWTSVRYCWTERQCQRCDGVYVGRRCDIGGNLEPAHNNKVSPTKSKNPISEQGVEHLITFSWI